MAFDKDEPFGNKKFLSYLLEEFGKIELKLYGKIKYKTIFKEAKEIDLDLGKIHVTEMDLKKISALMDKTNKKFGTGIMYCLYHSDQFVGHMLLNIRGPNAPKLLNANIKFD